MFFRAHCQVHERINLYTKALSHFKWRNHLLGVRNTSRRCMAPALTIFPLPITYRHSPWQTPPSNNSLLLSSGSCWCHDRRQQHVSFDNVSLPYVPLQPFCRYIKFDSMPVSYHFVSPYHQFCHVLHVPRTFLLILYTTVHGHRTNAIIIAFNCRAFQRTVSATLGQAPGLFLYLDYIVQPSMSFDHSSMYWN